MGKDSPHHGNKWMPCLYATYFGLFKDIAEKHGYALAVHGSFTRDMDLILVPWVEDASPVKEVLDGWSELIGIKRDNRLSIMRKYNGAKKPHGRYSYTLSTGAGGYVDVSVVPQV